MNGPPLKPFLNEPEVAEIIQMEPETLKTVLSYRIFQGKEISRQDSKFTGFAAKVHSIQDVAACYKLAATVSSLPLLTGI